MADDTAVPDAEHPWPWLEPFDEASKAFFNGRGDDIQALLRSVAAAPVALLYGKSGLGKTSLLRAGLFPLLPAQGLLPVLLRGIEPGGGPGALSARLLRLLNEALARHRLHWTGPPTVAPADSPIAALWELLHDRERALQGPDGRRWTPLFVLDQFEELFTLLPRGAARDAMLVELGNLLENRVPAVVEQRLDAHPDLVDRVDLDRHGCRFLIALREDFLPELDALAPRMPRLQANRCRLRAMSPAQALEAVARTGGRLVTPEAAKRIVAFLARPANDAMAPDERPVEPALLSLLCASLNAERLARRPPAATLDVQDLEGRGARVIEQFYDRAFEALPPPRRAALADWLERELITASGTRRPFPRGDIDASLREDIGHLVAQRLLRYQSGEGGEQVELVHDRLAAVAQARARMRREAAEAQRRAEAERDLATRRLQEEEQRRLELQRRREAEQAQWERERAERIAIEARRRLWVGSAIGALLLVALGSSLFLLVQRQRTEKAEAERASAVAALQTQQAEERAREADALQRATQTQLAEAQKERDRHAEVLGKAAEALRQGGPGAAGRALQILQQASGQLAQASQQYRVEAEQCPAGRRLYPQVGERSDLDLVDRLAPALRRDGWIVLRTEVVEARRMPRRTELRYFRRAEARIAAEAAASLTKSGLSALTPVYVPNYEESDKLRPCHFELWLVAGDR
jgi:hypothetical protein